MRAGASECAGFSARFVLWFLMPARLYYLCVKGLSATAQWRQIILKVFTGARAVIKCMTREKKSEYALRAFLSVRV